MEFDCIHYKSLPGKDEVELVSAFEKTSNLAFFQLARKSLELTTHACCNKAYLGM